MRGNDETENRARLEISSEFWMKRTITTTSNQKMKSGRSLKDNKRFKIVQFPLILAMIQINMFIGYLD